MDNFKKCSKCGEVKLLDCFSKDKTRKDGHQRLCIYCIAEYRKTYYFKNPEKLKAKIAAYYANNNEKIKIKDANYRAKNKRKIKIITAKYRKNLPEKYIKSMIKQQTGIPNEHITQDLIETKRLQILIQRKLKELSK